MTQDPGLLVVWVDGGGHRDCGGEQRKMNTFASKDDVVFVGKEIFKSICSLSNYYAPIVRFWDAMENKKDHDNIRKEVEKIWIAIGQNPIAIESRFLELIDIFQQQHGINADFRKIKSCHILMRELSNSSQDGLRSDFIPIEHFQEVLVSELNPDDPLQELKLVASELKRQGLINSRDDYNSKIGFRGIDATEEFFWKTDHIFQEWNPRQDAKEICILVIGKGEADPAENSSEINKQTGWDLRRLNPALAYLYHNNLIQKYDRPVGTNYFRPWIKLTGEASFFVKDQSW